MYLTEYWYKSKILIKQRNLHIADKEKNNLYLEYHLYIY